ncbi:MAG: single-stranded DNA-binding protein [Actinobacteria bacterium]|nr:single-stranded DNA-binding protein [Actinomycetota bacterium]
MFYEDENTVVLTGNLTREVETRQSPGSTLVANIRIGVNGRRKEGDQWVDKPNFFTVVTFGKSAENAKKYLAQGRRILVKGRLDWSEYDKDGETRQSVQIIAERIRYLPSKASIEAQAQGDAQTTMVETAPEPATEPAAAAEPVAEPSAESQQPVGVGVGGEDDRPPF